MNQTPIVTIPLRDGTQAAIAADSLRVGEKVYALGDIQDARQVAPDPVTIALRIANERHVVELQPARRDDGAVLLEALFRLRPELRPAGFESPTTLPPGFPPMSPARQAGPSNPWGAHPSFPPHPGMYPSPPGGYTPPLPPEAYRARPAMPGGRLTPYPRSVPELIAAIFELFMAHWRRWLLLGLVALLIPEMISGVVDALFHVLGGNSLWAGLQLAPSVPANQTIDITSTALPSGSDLLLAVFNLLISAVVGVVVGGWVAAVIGIASRGALFGQAPEVGPAVRVGAKRALPAIGANILSGALTLLILLPIISLYAVLLTQYGAALRDPNSLDPSSSAAASFTVLGCLTLILLVPSVIVAPYVFVRLLLSPYIAATEPLGPVAALRKSWNLTRGHWWHTVLPLLVVGLLLSVLTIPVGFVQYVSFGVATLVAIPLMGALTAPLSAIASIAVLYDLRLRREGFASLRSEGSAGEDAAPASM